jgi:pantetheine-phosphate adenylyltransferase
MKMSKKCVIGGTYDPPTNGHLHIIKKACNLFDEVIVVIAQNPNKKTMFSLEERKTMVKDMVQDLENVKVEILENYQYLVNYAYDNGATSLIRGIRDNIDFSYEQGLCRTNKQIQPKVETVYLMPDDAYSIVSSSWVKGLVGMNEWRKIIEPHVSNTVLKKLEEKFLYGVVMDVCKQLDIEEPQKLWNYMLTTYPTRAYHNFSHLISGLEAFNVYYPEFDNKTHISFIRKDAITLYSWLLHDVDDSEDISAEMAICLLGNRKNFSTDYRGIVRDLISATKHRSCEYATEAEQAFASIDLLCLALPDGEYDVYSSRVFDEYMEKSGLKYEEFVEKWHHGRSDFLKKMLARKFIYPWAQIRNSTRANEYGVGDVQGGYYETMEHIARKNLKYELDSIGV